MTTLHHISEHPTTFEDYADYIAALAGLVRGGYIEEVAAVAWRKGEHIKSELVLKHSPKFVSLTLTNVFERLSGEKPPRSE